MKIANRFRNWNRIVAVLTCGMFSVTISSLAWASPPGGSPSTNSRLAALELANADLQSSMDSLEQFVRQLHRNSAAVVRINEGGSSPEEFTSLELVLDFCTEQEYRPNLDCPSNLRDLSIELSEDDSGMVFSFDANVDLDFDAIVDLLTNDENGWIRLSIFTGQQGRTSSTAQVSSHFREFLAPGKVDLAGFTISQIKISVDSLRIIQSVNTEYDLSGRMFYVLAE